MRQNCRIPEWSEVVLKTMALNGVGGSIPLYGVGNDKISSHLLYGDMV